MKSKFAALVVSTIMSAATTFARADTVFSDDFNSGAASTAWSNTLGNWTADGSVYRAQQPNNFPNAHSFVSTFPSLTDFSVTVDVNAARDGGVWLRAHDAPTSAVGVTGVLLIFLNDGRLPNTLFWHEVTNGQGPEFYGSEHNIASNQFLGNFSLRIEVQGNTYSAFVNGSSTPATTFISDKFTSGYVGLYDHNIFRADQSFDNFQLSVSVPGPIVGAGLPGLLVASLGWLGWRRRYKAALTNRENKRGRSGDWAAP